MNTCWRVTLSLAILLGMAVLLQGKDPADGVTRTGQKVSEKINDISESVLRFNIRSKTFGGKQFWTDYLVQHEWRIQRHVVSNHYRLLNDDNHRHAWGTFKQCKKSLAELSKQKKIPPVQGKVVLLLHGLGRTRGSMEELRKHLDKRPGFTAISLSYASTRASLEQHARALANVVKNIPQEAEIYVVGHSMGNLVLRYYLSSAKNADPRIKRIVMLAPPNQGAALATLFKDNHIFHIFWGTSGEEIAVNWDQLARKLATPECEFGIIAGGNIKSIFNNPFIKGEDDLVLRVEETRLAGAHDFAIIPSYHGRIMNHAQTKAYTSRFLEKGHFISESRRVPIPHPEAERP